MVIRGTRKSTSLRPSLAPYFSPSLTRSLIHSLIYSQPTFIHWRNFIRSFSLTISYFHSLTWLVTHLIAHSLIRQHIHLLIGPTLAK